MAPWQQQVQAKVAGAFFSSPGVTFCTNCIFQVSISVENRSNGRVRCTLMRHRCCGIEPPVMIARYRRPPTLQQRRRAQLPNQNSTPHFTVPRGVTQVSVRVML
jgi:hypothetical protein